MPVRMIVFLLCVMAARAAAPDGEALYKQRCALVPRRQAAAAHALAPGIAARTPESIYQAMFEGAMKPQSAGLSPRKGAPSRGFSPARNSARFAVASCR